MSIYRCEQTLSTLKPGFKTATQMLHGGRLSLAAILLIIVTVHGAPLYVRTYFECSGRKEIRLWAVLDATLLLTLLQIELHVFHE
jgi:hypothetical protein